MAIWNRLENVLQKCLRMPVAYIQKTSLMTPWLDTGTPAAMSGFDRSRLCSILSGRVHEQKTQSLFLAWIRAGAIVVGNAVL